MTPLTVAEAKGVLRVHLTLLYKWADANPGQTVVSTELREALLNVLSRMYVIVEELPIVKNKEN